MVVHALSIAGSDPSGGAGIQADLKTFSALRAYGMAALTALTAQNTRAVSGVQPVPATFVTAQLDAIAADVRIDTIKIGMLHDAAVIEAVGEFLARDDVTDCVVLDPVMVATSGDRLLDDEAVEAMRALLPRAAVITPNLDEAAVLTGDPRAGDVDAMRASAAALRELGAPRVHLKGGHLTDAAGATDLFLDGEREVLLTQPWVETENTHGTGCSLSSALAALRPVSADWVEAATRAKQWLTDALRRSDVLEVGGGHGPVHHFHQWW